ncbi:MAG: hypothetical protein ACOH5I_23435 [Oligoflexus sp.]
MTSYIQCKSTTTATLEFRPYYIYVSYDTEDEGERSYRYLQLYSHDSLALKESFTASTYKIELLVSELNRGRVDEAFWVDLNLNENGVSLSSSEDPTLSLEIESCAMSEKLTNYIKERGFQGELPGNNLYDRYLAQVTIVARESADDEFFDEMGFSVNVPYFSIDRISTEDLSAVIFTKENDQNTLLGEWTWNSLLSLDATVSYQDGNAMTVFPTELSLNLTSDFTVFVIHKGVALQMTEYSLQLQNI